MYISIDALFGCVRKCSAGTSAKAPNHGESMFIEQHKVDSFLSSNNKKSTSKALVSFTINIHVSKLFFKNLPVAIIFTFTNKYVKKNYF